MVSNYGRLTVLTLGIFTFHLPQDVKSKNAPHLICKRDVPVDAIDLTMPVLVEIRMEELRRNT
jgi:hypothetical protein